MAVEDIGARRPAEVDAPDRYRDQRRLASSNALRATTSVDGAVGRSGAAGRFAAGRARKETRPTPFSQPRGAAEKRYSTPSNESTGKT